MIHLWFRAEFVDLQKLRAELENNKQHFDEDRRRLDETGATLRDTSERFCRLLETLAEELSHGGEPDPKRYFAAVARTEATAAAPHARRLIEVGAVLDLRACVAVLRRQRAAPGFGRHPLPRRLGAANLLL